MGFHIGFVTAGLRINPLTFGETALGGSETALVCLSRALRKLGHQVTVFCVLDGWSGLRDKDDVQYFDVSTFPTHAPTYVFDVLVVSRHVGYALEKVHANTIWYWAHDIAPQTGFDGAAWPLERMLFLSKYHKGLYEAVLPDGFTPFMHVTRNGIDIEQMEMAVTTGQFSSLQKRAHKFCYTSRPERGAMFLLGSIWPRIRQQIPNAELHLAWYEVAGHMAIDPAVQKDIDFVMHLVKESKRLGVTYHGALSKADLYSMMYSCNALLYSSTFPESSCISAIEAMALGTIPITTDAYALTETVGNWGRLIPGKPGDEDYDEMFVGRAVDCHDNFDFGEPERKSMMAATLAHHSWHTIAAEWQNAIGLFFINRRNQHEVRILENLLYHSDVIAVRDFVKEHRALESLGAVTGGISSQIAACGRRAQAMIDQCQEHKEEYMRGSTHEHWRDNGRFLKVIEQIKPALDMATSFIGGEAGRILDIGCGTGDFLGCLHVQYPQLDLVGLDFSPECIAEAKDFVVAQKLDASKFTFATSQVETMVLNSRSYDVVFAGEVLEHVEDTQAMLTLLEGTVKNGGTVCITTPCGPWSQIAFRKEGPGIERHIHHFTMRDLQDILGGRGCQMKMEYISSGVTERGELIGNFVTSWQVHPARMPFGYVNVGRKVLTGRPYQKITACLIARNEENTILRCLKSFNRVVDEILIGDTGSTDLTGVLAEKMGARVIPIPWDIDHDGVGNFSAWRNAVLVEASGDWIFQIDCDEVMANGPQFRKYVESPSLNAYCMKQVHLCLDKQMPPDEPPRLFRNRQGYCYKGVVHEIAQRDSPGYENFITPFLVMSDVFLPHDGYLQENIRYDKTAFRNLPMLQKDRRKSPDRKYGRMLEMRDVLNICLWARSKYGQLRPLDIAALRNLVLVYEEFFSKPGEHAFNTANHYYQNALALLSALDVPPHGQRHVPLNANIRVVTKLGGLLQSEIDQVPAQSMWVKDIAELRKYLMYQCDMIERTLGPLALPLPQAINDTPEVVPDHLTAPLSVPGLHGSCGTIAPNTYSVFRAPVGAVTSETAT